MSSISSNQTRIIPVTQLENRGILQGHEIQNGPDACNIDAVSKPQERVSFQMVSHDDNTSGLLCYPVAQAPSISPQSHNPVDLLRNGAAMVLSVSGGKDSDAMSHYLLDLRQREGWTGDVALVHADLGRAEWHTTPDYVRGLADRLKVPLHVVRWRDGALGDLIDRIWQRYEADPTRPCWPSSAARYCTSDLKRGPISVWIRNAYPTGTVVCAMGLRADESPARAKKQVVEVREDCTTKNGSRLVLNWNPIHTWTRSEVWQYIHNKADGIAHPAYELGNERLSCACCVLGSVSDLFNGATHNPDTYRELCRIEAVTGWSFRKGFWLSDLQPDLLPHETREAVAGHKARLTEGKPIQTQMFEEVAS